MCRCFGNECRVRAGRSFDAASGASAGPRQTAFQRDGSLSALYCRRRCDRLVIRRGTLCGLPLQRTNVIVSQIDSRDDTVPIRRNSVRPPSGRCHRHRFVYSAGTRPGIDLARTRGRTLCDPVAGTVDLAWITSSGGRPLPDSFDAR